MEDQVRALATLFFTGVVIVWTTKGCIYCWQGLNTDDKAGLWISVAETLSMVAWIGVTIDAFLFGLHLIEPTISGGIFWIVFFMKASSTIIKADFGYKRVRDTYRNMRRTIIRRINS